MSLPLPIHLLPLKDRLSIEEVLVPWPNSRVIACDFYVEGIEQGQEVTGGYQLDRLLNIDHHAPTDRMSRLVSSANLAIERVSALPIDPQSIVVINHTDCDSILSSAIMAGLLPPDPQFGAAAIAADHTGEEDPVADLLQALDRARDIDFSLRNLHLLLEGQSLEQRAALMREERRHKRAQAQEFVAGNKFRFTGPVAVGVFDAPLDGEFFPALLPGAAVIATFNPLAGRPGYWQVKVRLGLAAPPGFSINALGIDQFDPAYGGRWNAGSNKRGGGTTLTPDAYAEALFSKIQANRRSIPKV